MFGVREAGNGGLGDCPRERLPGLGEHALVMHGPVQKGADDPTLWLPNDDDAVPRVQVQRKAKVTDPFLNPLTACPEARRDRTFGVGRVDDA